MLESMTSAIVNTPASPFARSSPVEHQAIASRVDCRRLRERVILAPVAQFKKHESNKYALGISRF